MSLDLNDMLTGWECPREEVSARLVRADDGNELLQLRVDLGLLQMFVDGRPDGQRYRGMPSALAYCEHEIQVGGDPTLDDYRELHRELQQHNYRRLALSSLGEELLQRNDCQLACDCLEKAVRDIRHCLEIIDHVSGMADDENALDALHTTLVFNQARLLARLRAAEMRYEEAIEAAESGVIDLEQMLGDDDGLLDDEEDDPGVAYLQQLAQRLREQSGITQTLRERLDDAIEHEDFEAAARLRDELERRDNAHI